MWPLAKKFKIFTCPYSSTQNFLGAYSKKITKEVSKALGFPSCSVVKNLPANAGNKRDMGSVPGSERSSGQRRKWQPTRVFLPGKLHGQQAWRVTSPWEAKSWTQPSYWASTQANLYTHEYSLLLSFHIYVSYTNIIYMSIQETLKNDRKMLT